MRFIPAAIGVQTADAEDVTIHYDNGTLVLRYTDYGEQKQEKTFHEVLAFRWNDDFDLDEPHMRDDTTYEVVDSPWLAKQMKQQLPGADFAHYKLCFNVSGVLDVLCRRF